jgi:hypothetical protein
MNDDSYNSRTAFVIHRFNPEQASSFVSQTENQGQCQDEKDDAYNDGDQCLIKSGDSGIRIICVLFDDDQIWAWLRFETHAFRMPRESSFMGLRQFKFGFQNKLAKTLRP